MKKVYLNNCITTRPAPEVIEAVIPYMTDDFYFPENFIENGTKIISQIQGFKESLAKTINAKPDEVHFTSSGTLANNIAIKGYISDNASKGTHIICSTVDYPDILTNAAFFEQSGFDVTYVKADWDGFIDLDDLEKAIRPDTILMMTTLANHTIGTIQPLKKIREILDRADHKIALHVDAGQAYGKIPIDVNDPAVDLMSFSAHKIHGPQGIGMLYQRKGVSLGQVIHGINRMDNANTGGMNIGLMAGFVKAAEITFNDFEKQANHLRTLTDHILDRVENEIPDVMLNGPRGEGRAPHNMNISFDYIEGEAIMMMMDIKGYTIATGSACASQGLKANYILMATGRNHVQSHGSMKFTVSRYNTIEEIDAMIEELKEIVQTLRERSTLYSHRN